MDARAKSSEKRFDYSSGKSKTSQYLLSGGFFVCGRFGTNLKQIWEKSQGYDPTAYRLIQETKNKITNIQRSTEDGLADTAWANARLSELVKQRQTLSASMTTQGNAPQIDSGTAMAYRRDAERVIAKGTNSEKKKLLSSWVDKIELAPDRLEVEIRYKIPEAVVDRMGAGHLIRLINNSVASNLYLDLTYMPGGSHRVSMILPVTK